MDTNNVISLVDKPEGEPQLPTRQWRELADKGEKMEATKEFRIHHHCSWLSARKHVRVYMKNPVVYEAALAKLRMEKEARKSGLYDPFARGEY